MNVVGDLAHPDKLYPILEWRPKVDTVQRRDDGDYDATFRDRFTVRCAPGVGFAADSFEVRGRPDGSTGEPPTVANVEPSVVRSSRRDEVVPVLKQLAQAAAACGPGPAGAEFRQSDAHLLEIYNGMKGLYRGCLVLFEQGLPEEAMILGRSLFRDAMRLDQAACADDAQRTALAFGWRLDSVQASRQILSQWAPDEDASERESEFQQLQTDIISAAQRFDVQTPSSFEAAEAWAERVGHDGLAGLDLLATAMSDGTDLATRSRRRATAEGTTGLHDAALDSWAFPLAASYVGGGYLVGVRAALTIFGWDDPGGQVDRAEAQLEELQARATADRHVVEHASPDQP